MSPCAQLYRAETEKAVWQFVADLKENGLQHGLLIHNEDHMEMANTFGSHGVQVADGFDLHMIQVCKPEKAAGSLQKNPERAALMPKFITAFSAAGRTQVRFLRLNREIIEELVQDAEFAVSVGATYDEIERVIQASL
ncbi:MAG: DUF302 domain-containing protein [Geobacter sp.]